MPSSVSSVTNVMSQEDLALLEEEELKGLRESLLTMDRLTVRTVDTIRSFDARLQRLETSIRPIHRATQDLARQQEEVENSLLGIKDVIKYFDLAAREEQYILKGPQEDDIGPYLQSIGRVREAIQYLHSTGMQSGERALVQLEKVLYSALKHLRELFKHKLQTSGQLLSSPKEAPKELLTSLSSLAQYLMEAEKVSSSGSTSYRRTYSDVRGKQLVETVTNLAASSSIVDTSDPTGYESQSSDFIPLTNMVLALLQSEQHVASIIIPEQEAVGAWADAVGPMVDLYTATGESIIQLAKRHLTTQVFRLFDMVNILEAREQEFSSILEMAGKAKKVNDLVNSSRAISLASFPEYLMEIKGLGTKPMSLPENGTIHSVTSTTMTHLRKLVESGNTTERMLERLGDGNWRLQSKIALESRGNTSILSNYIRDVMDALTEALTAQVMQYRLPSLSAIFLMNNIHHMIKVCLTSSISNIISPEVITRLEGMMKQQQSSYQECWNGCVALLMDTTYIKGGAVKTSLGGAERQAIKDKFKNFNTEFEELYHVQKGYSISDPDLRRDIISHIKSVVLPMYTRFLEKYRHSDFTKNHSKYIRFTAEDLEGALNGFFDKRG